MNRRRFLQSTVAAAGGTLFAPHSRGHTTTVDPEAFLAQAQSGIEQHRKSPLTISVTTDPDRPSVGVTIEIEQLRHSFLWGCNLFSWAIPGEPMLEAAYRARFAALFNYATLGFYWNHYEPERGRPRHALTEAILHWCQIHDITCKGHPLAWANIADPSWLPADAAQIHAASLGRVRDLVNRFRGRIDLWDVVNEPSLLLWANTRLGAWAQAVGTHSFVRQHLLAARAANPNATLLVNEVITPYPSYSLLDSLRDHGKPLFDAVGIQSHMHHPGPWPLDRMWALCDRFAGLGTPLHFTEFTILSAPVTAQGWVEPTPASEQAQADQMVHRYTLLFGHPAVQAITWWDLSDRGAWKSAPGGLLRADMSPKPAYEMLQELIRKQWWTSIQATTDAQGKFTCRAFHGRHKITLRLPDGRAFSREMECAPQRSNELRFHYPAANPLQSKTSASK
jgi:endo-1,4-beta-xylanase